MSAVPGRPRPSDLRGRRFDLIVVGGGAHGCGVARDAALRGLKVLLLEQDDLASGTSGVTSKLAHGGLRYIEQLRLGLVRESLRERRILLDIAPHLVRPLPFLVPVYRAGPRGAAKLRTGLTLYDLLAGRASLGRHRRLSARECLEREPGLNAEGLQCGFLFHDAQIDDARVVLETALDARAHEAVLLTRARVEGLLQDTGRVKGVRVRDLHEEQTLELEAGLVVNAAGPWYAELARRQSLAEVDDLRLSRGSHVVVPRLTRGHALLLSAHRDGRVIFVLPWKGNSLVGTTEIAFTGDPSRASVDEEEIGYLLEEIARVLPERAPRAEDVLARFTGVRALAPGTERDLGRLSRRAEIRVEAPGLLGILGGKLTTHRAVAERTVDRALRLLEHARCRPCRTALQPLPGGNVPDMNSYFRIAEGILLKRYGLDVSVLRYLLGIYGARHTEILQEIDEDPSLARTLEDGLPFTRAEILHAVRREMAMTVEDLLWRRTYRAHLGPLSPAARGRWEEALAEARDRVYAS